MTSCRRLDFVRRYIPLRSGSQLKHLPGRGAGAAHRHQPDSAAACHPAYRHCHNCCSWVLYREPSQGHLPLLPVNVYDDEFPLPAVQQKPLPPVDPLHCSTKDLKSSARIGFAYHHP